MSTPFFDTNIIIDWLQDRPGAASELERYSKRRNVQDLLSPFEIVELDARIGDAAADIRYRTRMKLLDAMILATAQVNGAILITRNTKDFPANMPGIRVPYTL